VTNLFKTLAAITMITACHGQIINTNNVFLDFIIGPQVPIGSSAVTTPWHDTVAIRAASVAIQNHLAAGNINTSRFKPWYKDFQRGTISVTGGSATVTGSDTALARLFCPTDGITPHPASFIAWRYTGTDGNAHYTMKGVKACSSETSISLTGAYPFNPGAGLVLPNCSPCSGLSFAAAWDGDLYFARFGSAPENYYDNAEALKILFVRSGKMTYQAAYRTIVDQHWESPEFDQGTMYAVGNNWNSESRRGEPRTYALDGVFIRADDGKPNYWTGLRMMRDYMMTTDFMQPHTFMSDLRDVGYIIRFLAIGCDGDPILTEQTRWCSDLKTAYTNAVVSTQRDGAETFGAWSNGKASFDGNGGTVSVSGTSVTVSGRTWTSGDFKTDPVLMIFDGPTMQPSSNGLGAYGCTFVDSTHCRISGWSAGNVSGKGFALPDPTYGPVGITVQPFFMAIMAIGCETAAAVPAFLSDAKYQQGFRACSDAAVSWLMKYGYYAAEKGNYYFISANCQPGNAKPICTSATNTNQTRMYAIETPYAVGLNYRRTKNASLKAFADNLMDAMWVPRSCNANPQYLADFDSSCGGFGFNLQVVPGQTGPGNPKFYGQMDGTGNTSAWFALRISTSVGMAPGNSGAAAKNR
jgi:hypothetical protein